MHTDTMNTAIQTNLNTSAANGQCYGQSTPALVPGFGMIVIRSGNLSPSSEKKVKEPSGYYDKGCEGNELQDEARQSNLQSITQMFSTESQQTTDALTCPPSFFVLRLV